MANKRLAVLADIARARGDLDRALEQLESLSTDDRHRFSYSVHALNNYLMVVSNTIALLRAKLSPGDRDARHLLDSLKQATQLMMSTARGVLTATPDVLPPLLLERTSLSEIAGGACQAYDAIARRKQVRIRFKTLSCQDQVLTDRVAAGAVLDNLLSNAVKYADPGTTVLVCTQTEHDDALCSVRDRGPGLSPEDQGRLFQRGVRLSAQPTGGEPSTGYGLAIASDLTAALGGHLWCTSILGEGSCFTFSLPLDHNGVPVGV